LKYFDFDLKTIIETDTLHYIISEVLSQRHPNPATKKTTLHSIAFFLEKMMPTEYNYSIGDKELLAIVNALKKCYIYMHTLPWPFLILTNYYNF
jgi:hypothetical protein